MNHHYKKLGLRVPKDYFKRSKEEILGKINPKEKQQQLKIITSAIIIYQ